MRRRGMELCSIFLFKGLLNVIREPPGNSARFEERPRRRDDRYEISRFPREFHPNRRFNRPPIEAVPVQNLNPDILMVQTAKDGNGCNVTDLLRSPKIWCILAQQEMRPDLVVIKGIILQHVAQVRFAEHHEVVQ